MITTILVSIFCFSSDLRITPSRTSISGRTELNESIFLALQRARERH
uniref:Uncharacterized protein n=1 Tax=Aegilops tauschii subsp. strangulata TaxID=200361 RepID=A0A453QBA0_AEGTS